MAAAVGWLRPSICTGGRRQELIHQRDRWSGQNTPTPSDSVCCRSLWCWRVWNSGTLKSGGPGPSRGFRPTGSRAPEDPGPVGTSGTIGYGASEDPSNKLVLKVQGSWKHYGAADLGKVGPASSEAPGPAESGASVPAGPVGPWWAIIKAAHDLQAQLGLLTSTMCCPLVVKNGCECETSLKESCWM